MKEEETISVKFDVWRKFCSPFICVCCGKEISKEQFVFSQLCGYCDLGKCAKGIGRFTKYEKRHKLHLWKQAEKDTKLNILEELEKNKK